MYFYTLKILDIYFPPSLLIVNIVFILKFYVLSSKENQNRRTTLRALARASFNFTFRVVFLIRSSILSSSCRSHVWYVYYMTCKWWVGCRRLFHCINLSFRRFSSVGTSWTAIFMLTRTLYVLYVPTCLDFPSHNSFLKIFQILLNFPFLFCDLDTTNANDTNCTKSFISSIFVITGKINISFLSQILCIRIWIE